MKNIFQLVKRTFRKRREEIFSQLKYDKEKLKPIMIK